MVSVGNSSMNAPSFVTMTQTMSEMSDPATTFVSL